MAVRFVGGAVALDHDLAQFRAPHAVDRIQRDPMWLFDDLALDLGAVPMPRGPARAVGDRGADLAMESPLRVAVDMAGPVRRNAQTIEHPEKAAAFGKIDKAAIERKPQDLVGKIHLGGKAEPERRAEMRFSGCPQPLIEPGDDLSQQAAERPTDAAL